MDLLPPQKFFLQPHSNEGNLSHTSTFYRCNNTDDTCNCRQGQCSGNNDFCHIFPCSSESRICNCYLTREEAKLIYVTSELTLINPPQLSIEMCIFEKNKLKVTRNLLEHEEAQFQQNNLSITFKDPILTLPELGRVILRTPDMEHILTVPEDLSIILPFEMLIFKTTLSIIFINQKGLSVSGTIHLSGKSVCRISRCFFCREGLQTISCWPTKFQYLFYVVTVVLTLLALYCLKSVFKTIHFFIRLILFFVHMIFKHCKYIARLSLLLGAYIGVTVRHTAQAAIAIMEERATDRPSVNMLSLVVIALCLVCGSVSADCSDHSIIHSELEMCDNTNDKIRTCHISTTAEITLHNINHETCLWFQDKKDTNLFSLKVRLSAVECKFNTKRQYFTFPVRANHISQVSCFYNYYCGKGTHCAAPQIGNQGLHFEAETPESREYPGISTCSAGGIGTGCHILTRASCNFRRTWFVPDLLNSFEVSTITGHTCQYKLSVKHVENGTLTQVTLKDTIYTPNGIRLSILGAFDQPQLHLQESLVTRVGNPTEAYLVHTAQKHTPKTGNVGVVQANSSYTKIFIFDPLMSTCDFYEDTLRCQTPSDPVLLMQKSKENALPITRDLHLLQMRDGQLMSSLLASSAVRVQLNFRNFKLSVTTNTICPKFLSNSIKVSGCYKCQIFAQMTLEASSTCQPGIANVLFQELLVYTKAVHLSTSEQTLTIKFLAEKKCYNEKLCLKAQTLIQCLTVDFCLQEPSIELLKFNANYTRTVADSSPGSIFDWVHFPSLDSVFYVFKFAAAVLVMICLVITFMSTCVTCCCRR